MLFKLSSISSLVSDQELIESYRKKGDQQHLAELFTRYTHLIMGVCMKYLKNEEAAKDGVMNLYESLSSKILISDVNNMGAWLYVVTKNYCLGRLRKQTRIDSEQKKFIENMDFELLEHPMTKHALEDQLIALEHCVKQLDKSQNECISLFYFKKKTYQEITNVTGFGLKNVKSYLQNGKRKLKLCIETTIEKDY